MNLSTISGEITSQKRTSAPLKDLISSESYLVSPLMTRTLSLYSNLYPRAGSIGSWKTLNADIFKLSSSNI